MSEPLATLGPALRALREDRGLRQNVTASRAGITKAMLSAYENGQRRPSLGTLERIIGAIGVSWTDLAYLMVRIEQQ